MLTAMPIALAAQAVAAVNEQLAAGAFRLPGKKVATTIEPACDYYIAEASFKEAGHCVGGLRGFMCATCCLAGQCSLPSWPVQPAALHERSC